MDGQELVKELLEKQGVSGYKIAKDLKVRPSTVYCWRDGKKQPNGAHMLELLRKAGRLAAVVVLGSVVGVTSAPQDAAASQETCAKSAQLLHIIRSLLRRGLVWFRLFAHASPSTTLAV